MHYVSKLTTNKETGELDLKTANLLLKHGGNPRLETVDVRLKTLTLFEHFTFSLNYVFNYSDKRNLRTLLCKIWKQ